MEKVSQMVKDFLNEVVNASLVHYRGCQSICKAVLKLRVQVVEFHSQHLYCINLDELDEQII